MERRGEDGTGGDGRGRVIVVRATGRGGILFSRLKKLSAHIMIVAANKLRAIHNDLSLISLMGLLTTG